MSRILTSREKRALEILSHDKNEFLIKGQISGGVGQKTLDDLVTMGLIEKGPSTRFRNVSGYRITDDGWRALYGMTYDEIMASEKPVRLLRVPKWPPE